MKHLPNKKSSLIIAILNPSQMFFKVGHNELQSKNRESWKRLLHRYRSHLVRSAARCMLPQHCRRELTCWRVGSSSYLCKNLCVREYVHVCTHI